MVIAELFLLVFIFFAICSLLAFVFEFKKKKNWAMLITCIASLIMVAIFVKTINDKANDKAKNKPQYVNVIDQYDNVKKVKVRSVCHECFCCGERDGTIVWTSDDYCSNCGMPIDNTPMKVLGAIYYCPYCDEITGTIRDYCKKCGQDLRTINKQIIEKADCRKFR